MELQNTLLYIHRKDTETVNTEEMINPNLIFLFYLFEGIYSSTVETAGCGGLTVNAPPMK